ncbi:hypothetical protein GCM10022223_52770 [Kineosporia mesophila]|uniref:CHAT domain-containing protein n=1 Tax=Kineosporia mesophila TaxID=566012 RepID=A0ABP7ABH4_9ACTN|nr:hypothetical protein [Kineosporia mesophila]MCD5351339.1 hypothetical protein [Kineosporia mesophila]
MDSHYDINIVAFGTDKLSTRLSPLCEGLIQALSDSASGRRTLRLNTQPVAPGVDDLVAGLNRPAFLTVVAGHGWSHQGNGEEWWLGQNNGNAGKCVSLENLAQRGVSVPAQILLVDACWANTAREAWTGVLADPENTDLLLGTDIVRLDDAARWLGNFLLGFAGVPGKAELSPAQRRGLWGSVVSSLRVQEENSGHRVHQAFEIWAPANSPAEAISDSLISR